MQTPSFNQVFAVLVHSIGRERAASVCGVSMKSITNWCKGKPLPSDAAQAGAVALLLTVSDFEEGDFEHIQASMFIERCVNNATKC